MSVDYVQGGMERCVRCTKRAFCRHVMTSSGSLSVMVGLEAALPCQLSGGCASGMSLSWVVAGLGGFFVTA